MGGRGRCAAGFRLRIDGLYALLLEACGFDIEAVELMVATNQLQCTRTKRYVVLARKIP